MTTCKEELCKAQEATLKQAEAIAKLEAELEERQAVVDKAAQVEEKRAGRIATVNRLQAQIDKEGWCWWCGIWCGKGKSVVRCVVRQAQIDVVSIGAVAVVIIPVAVAAFVANQLPALLNDYCCCC